MQQICVEYPHKFWGFGVLPSTESSVQSWLNAIEHIASQSRLVGVIMGTRGLGQGLDDPRLHDVWQLLQDQSLTVFIHPHYGVTDNGRTGYGHVLPLAIGFPLETTFVCVCRDIVNRRPRQDLSCQEHWTSSLRYDCY
jgi:aminocarboxymuconate-semialdehyde decarboxylase